MTRVDVDNRLLITQFFFSRFSFITFPQILYDGFQAEPANVSVSANQSSLPSFEFVDILTADVSQTILPWLYFHSILQIAPQFLLTNWPFRYRKVWEILFKKSPKTILLSFRLLLAR